MTDREMLELAADAIGESIWESDGEYRLKGAGPWNPLTDDGDALRLAVDLGLVVSPGAAMIQGRQPFGQCVDEDECADKHAATRRAIVLAAAEIGREK